MEDIWMAEIYSHAQSNERNLMFPVRLFIVLSGEVIHAWMFTIL
jgi:hypothetical protein